MRRIFGNINLCFVEFILLFLIFFFQISAQQKPVLIISARDSFARNELKSDHQVVNIKDSLDGLKKLKHLTNKWIENGYLSLSVDSILFEKFEITAFVFFGQKYLWDSLQIVNFPPGIESSKEFVIGANGDKAFNLQSFKRLSDETLRYCENNGFPFAELFIDSAVVDQNLIKGRLVLNTKDLVKIDSLVLKGSPGISGKFLQHYIKIKSGNVYSQNKIDDIGRLIGELPYLEQTRPAELEFRKGKADIYLYLKNKPANFFNGIIGFSSGTEESSGFQITGDINLLLVNSFRIGEKISINWDKYDSKSQNLNIGIQLPYLFFVPLGIEFHFGLEKSNVDYLNTKINGAIDYSFSANNKITGYFSSKKSYLFNNDADADTTFKEFSMFTGGFGLFFNKTDYSYNPRQGYLIDVSTGYGSRSEVASNSGSVAEIAFRGELYIRLGRIGTIALINKSAGIFSNNNFYDNELFKIGGINTLRGFDEKSILASTYSIFSVEPRLIIGKNSALYMFADWAWYSAKQLKNTISDSPVGAGLGLNIDTRAGIFKISYALGRQFNNPLKFSDSKLHFGFNARF